MKIKVYCLAIGNGKISAFMPELGANFYASSASIIASLVESSVDELDAGWGSLKVWVIEVTEKQLEDMKQSEMWKG